MKLAIGPSVIGAVQLAYKANLSVLLEGPHGVGKSSMFVDAANHLGIECIVRDMEVGQNATRPSTRIIAHTGYLTFARRV